MLFFSRLYKLVYLCFLFLLVISCKETKQEGVDQGEPVQKSSPKVPQYEDQSKTLPGTWALTSCTILIDGKEKLHDLKPADFEGVLGFASQEIEYRPNKTFVAQYLASDKSQVAFQDGVWSADGRDLKIEVLKPSSENWTSQFVIKNNKLITKTFVDFDDDGTADDLMITQSDRQKVDR